MVIFKLVHIFQIFESFYRHLFVLDILYHLHFEELILYNFSFLKYIETFYAQTNVCVCIYLHGRVSLEPRLQIWVQAQMPGEHCALAAQK